MDVSSKQIISPWLYTTKRCTLACPYCYVRQCHDSMRPEVYSRVSEVLHGLFKSNKVLDVVYRVAGGEPMLAFHNWKNFASQAIEDYGRISVLTALGLELSDEEKEFLCSPGVCISTSLDGVEFSKPFHDGRSSSQLVMKNMDMLLGNGVNRRNFHVSTVVSPKSYKDIEQLALWVSERGLKWGVYFDHYDRDSDIEEPLRCILKAIDALAESGYDIYENFKFNNLSLQKSYGGCQAGRSLCAIDCDGTVYPCQTACEDHKEPWFNIFDSDAEERFMGTAYDRSSAYDALNEDNLSQECHECPIFELCHGGCKLNQESHGGTRVCRMNLKVVSHMIRNTIRTKEN